MLCEINAEKENRLVDSLMPGDTFVSSSKIYMRITGCGDYNAVNLQTGEVFKLLDKLVFFVNRHKVVSI